MTISNFTKIHKKILPLYKLSSKNKRDIFLFKSVIFYNGGAKPVSPPPNGILEFFSSEPSWVPPEETGTGTLHTKGLGGLRPAKGRSLGKLYGRSRQASVTSIAGEAVLAQPPAFPGEALVFLAGKSVYSIKFLHPRSLQNFYSGGHAFLDIHEGKTSIKNLSSISSEKSIWVCYSQSQYAVKRNKRVVRGAFEGSGDNIPVGRSPRSLDQYSQIPDNSSLFENEIALEKTALMSKGLFERQNILQCYKERNLLRLVVAFCDYEGIGVFGEGRGLRPVASPLASEAASRTAVRATAGLESFPQRNRFSSLNTKIKTNGSYSIFHKIVFPFHFVSCFLWAGVKIIYSRIISFHSYFSIRWRSHFRNSNRSLILFQLLIIPYTFLFGILYTFVSFQVSSTLTSKETSGAPLLIPFSKNFGRKQKSTPGVMEFTDFRDAGISSAGGRTLPPSPPSSPSASKAVLFPLHVPIETDNSALYSYSIQFHSFPYEILRLSHFSSKLFILWGFLTIWKGVRPAKSTRNEYNIQTRLILARKNKKRFSDVEGIEKFLPVLKTLIESFKKSFLFPTGILQLKESKLVESGDEAGRSRQVRLVKARTGSARFQGHRVGGAGKTSETELRGDGRSLRPSILKYPKGYLFIGPPGTGKTLLAQAVAGEAKVNLLCLSASEIQKQIDIGTRIGAIRLRNLFEQARKNTPCILFLDEIDAIGRARNEGMDLKLFTEFLIQMDSFSVKDGFIVIGTTNFLSSLDSAFVRSGRFDRIIGLNYPGKQTRISILKLYTEKGRNSFDTSISWNFFGERTKGLSAADLSKVVNESSLYLIQTKYLREGGGAGEASGTAEQSSLERGSEVKSRVPTSHSTNPLDLQEQQVTVSKILDKTVFQKIFLLIFSWFPFMFSHEKLVHTTTSLERGLERISHSSKS